MDSTSHSDDALFALMQSPSLQREEAFKAFYHRYAARIRTYCFSIMDNPHEAEDIFQETFIRFYHVSAQERMITNVSGYLFRIARHQCLDRKKYHTRTLSLDDILDNHSGDSTKLPDGMSSTIEMQNEIEKEELFRLVDAALSSLDDEYREAFVLREYDDLSYEQIAAITDTNVVNARTRVFRAKQKLKDILKPYIKDLEQH